MYPALCLGHRLEVDGARTVRTHATTRSPIGICGSPDYPVQVGFALRSFYEQGRETYLYNPVSYDAVVVVSDATGDVSGAMADIEGVFRPYGTERYALLRV